MNWFDICIVGIVLNFISFFGIANGQVEGAMGMGVILPFCFVPYLIFIPHSISVIWNWF